MCTVPNIPTKHEAAVGNDYRYSSENKFISSLDLSSIDYCVYPRRVRIFKLKQTFHLENGSTWSANKIKNSSMSIIGSVDEHTVSQITEIKRLYCLSCLHTLNQISGSLLCVLR